MDKILYIMRRFEEPSTWGTITALFAMVGFHLAGTDVKTLVDTLTIASGILGVFVSEARPMVK